MSPWLRLKFELKVGLWVQVADWPELKDVVLLDEPAVVCRLLPVLRCRFFTWPVRGLETDIFNQR